MGLQVSSRRRISDYELVRLVGSGAISEVYEARRIGLHGFTRRVALKRIRSRHRGDPRLVELFVAEARISASMSHPNLVHVLDFGEHEGELFLVMEFVDGLTCRDLLGAVSARHQSVELGPALHVVREVLRGLQFLHAHCTEAGQPVVHRDVVPSNVLLGRAGDVKVADLGVESGDPLSHRLRREGRHKAPYGSPEQLAGGPVDARSDLYSVGVLLIELLSGGPPRGRSVAEVPADGPRSALGRLRHAVPPGLYALLETLVASRPVERPDSAGEVARLLDLVAWKSGVELTDYALSEYMAALGVISLTSEIRGRSAAAPGVHRPARRMRPFAQVSTLPPRRLPVAAPSDSPPTRREPVHVADRRATTCPSPVPTVVYRLREAGPHAQPLPLAKVLGMLATGRLSYTTELARNDGPFLPVGSLVELARLAARAPYRFSEPLELRASEAHPITPGLVARRLFALVRDRRTGLLCAKSGGRQVRVYLVRGALVFSSSTDGSTLIGEYLARSGGLARTVVERALEEGWRRGQRVGDRLLEAGLVQPNLIVLAAVEQRQARLVDLLRCTTGTTYFVEGLESGEQDPCPPVAALPLLTEAVRHAFSLRDLTQLLAGVQSQYVARSPSADRLTMSLGLPLAVARALSRAHFAPNLDLLVQMLAQERVADPFETLQGIFIGLAVGALVSDGWEECRER